MAHQYMPKIFHDPHKNPPVLPPTYLMSGPLKFRGVSIKVFSIISRRLLTVDFRDYMNRKLAVFPSKFYFKKRTF